MRFFKLTLLMLLVSIVFTQCRKDEFFNRFHYHKKDHKKDQSEKMFTVTIKNVSETYDYFAAGSEFGVSGGDAAPPAHPGETITIHFHAGMNHNLSFASMYGASNDWFYAPDDEGIALFTGGTALEGDITGMIYLWDAGTEVDGSGSPGTIEHELVELETSPASGEDNIQVLLDYDDVSMFTLTINVLPGSATPLSPVAWVVHSDGQKPIFTQDGFDYGNGLELLAEMGDAGPLGEQLKMNSGYVSPIAPGIWVVHKRGFKPVFREGMPDYGNGLEMLSELGDPGTLYTSLVDAGYNTGVYNTPDRESNPGPLFPGQSYTFSFEADKSDYLSFASMLGKSNDLFFGPDDQGIRLFYGNVPLQGNITKWVKLWDAGTEVNEYPGAGIHQGGPEGPAENGDVVTVNDGFDYPKVSQMIEVTIKKN